MKRVIAAALSVVAAAATFAAAPEASAANYSLWVHGRSPDALTAIGNYASWSSYWGTTGTGVNPKSVNWRGYYDGTNSNTVTANYTTVINALDCYCTGNNWCYIGSHSTGDAMVGYILANFGGGTRYKKNATPSASGTCGNTDGTTQTGWNIKWHDAAAGAAGGTELSDSGSWAMGEPLVTQLKTSTMRSLYNHNTTRSVWWYMFAGASGFLQSSILPGQDDEVVAYHTSGAIAGSSGGSYCNPSDWFCDDLTLGTAAAENGAAKWSYHTVQFRDDNESYNHSGTIAKVRSDMTTYAY